MPADRVHSRLPPSPAAICRHGSVSGSPREAVDETLMSCERCRRRKKKCDKVRPICGGCSKTDEECVYLVRGQGAPSESSLRRKAEVSELRARCLELETRIANMTLELQCQRSNVPITPLPTPSGQISSSRDPLPPSLPNIRTSPRSSRLGLSLVERAVLRLLTKEHDAGSSVRGNIGRQLGTTSDDSPYLSTDNGTSPLFPPTEVVCLLVDRYFDFSYGVVPIVPRTVIDDDVRRIYDGKAIVDPLIYDTPNIHIFRLSALFVGTSGRLSDRELELFRPNITALHALMFKHLPAVFQLDDLSCLICILLLAAMAILVFVTSSPYEVTGIAVAMMLEMRLNEEDPTLDTTLQEERRRLFWSTFLVDRVVATHMTRPVGVPEETISIRLPQSDMGGMTTQSDDMPPEDFFRHLVLMRRLNGIMLEKITLAAQITHPDELFTDLRNQIDDWWNNVTSSFRNIQQSSSFPTSRHPFFELNYNLFLTHLYRPSRLFSQTTPMRMPILRAASSRAIELYWELYDRRRVPQNYVQLNNIVVLSVSLLYAVGENEGDPRNLDIGTWRTRALSDLDRCEKLLAVFCVGWPDVQRFREAFGQLAMSVKGRLIRSSQPSSLPAWGFPATVEVQEEPTATMGMIAQGAAAGQGLTDWTEVTDFGTIDVEAFLSSVGLSDWTSGA